MNPGDLVEPINEVQRGMNQFVVLPAERFIYLGEEIPWDDFRGMIGKPHPFHRGSTGIFLDKKKIGVQIPEPCFFCKILTPDGRVGWLHESWIRLIR